MEITEIKSRLNLAEVIAHYGYKPDKHHRIHCPFHEDNTPSLQLYWKTNTWHCFGCGKGTDQIDFIQLKESATPGAAIHKAKTLLQDTPKPSTKTPTPEKEITAIERTEALTQAFTYFARSVASAVQAKQYLEKRSLTADKLTVGYDGHMFHKSSAVTARLKALYLSLRLIYPDKRSDGHYHSFFDGCVVFPTYNEKGEIVNLYGRCVDDTKESKHRYLPGPHQGLYPRYPKAETESIIITESIIDAATLLQVKEITDKYEIMSCYGVNNFTAEHQKALKDLQALKEVILFYDGDEAGRAAVATHAKLISTIKPNVKISHVETPEKEDINSLAQGHEEGLFMQLLSHRKLFLLQETQEKTSPISQVEPSIHFDSDNAERLIFENEYLKATVWGGIDLYNVRKLRATLHLESRSNAYLEYRDTIDLYSHTHTVRLIREAGEKLETGSHAMSSTLTTLTQALEQYRQKERAKQREREEASRKKHLETFTPEEMEAGGQLLRDKNLMEKTEGYINVIGLTGEEEKGLLLFFILLTRMFKEPLHALVQGKSGSGKTYLLKKVASLIPKAQIKVTTALTENTLYHSLQDFWKHMVLLIEDLDGAFGALLPLREMMSNQSISKISTEKNLKTGKFEPKDLYVEGPLCVAGATTKDSIYEDNANRSFLIQVNESAEHQEKVLEYQRKEIAGLMDKRKATEAQLVFKTAQLQLDPLEVVIPFGEELRIPDYVFKKLRTNAHYLTLIKAIAFWHQKQRKIHHKSDGTRYIEATLEDVAWANKLSKEVLLRKSDELNGALRGFFEQLKAHVSEEKTKVFFASRVRTHFRMHPQQLKRYLDELRSRGYIRQTGRNQKTGYEYEIVIWDDYQLLQSGLHVMEEVLSKLKGA